MIEKNQGASDRRSNRSPLSYFSKARGPPPSGRRNPSGRLNCFTKPGIGILLRPGPISRFYAATAALLIEGMEYQKHSGVIAAIHKFLVKTE